jgi:hypothetical protein
MLLFVKIGSPELGCSEPSQQLSVRPLVGLSASQVRFGVLTGSRGFGYGICCLSSLCFGCLSAISASAAFCRGPWGFLGATAFEACRAFGFSSLVSACPFLASLR